MKDKELVENIVKFSGGKNNIKNVNNCMTRLRLEIRDSSLFDIKKIKSLDGVLDVILDRLEYPEIVLGPGKCRKCANICREEKLYVKDIDKLNITDDFKNNKMKVKNLQKNNMFKNIYKSFGEVFIPLTPGLIVAGICAGIAMVISQCIPTYKNNVILMLLYQVLSLVYVSFMTYINAWVGYSLAEKCGATPILGGMLGMITSLDGINEISKIIGLWNESMPLESILRMGKGGILAVFIGVIILLKVEKWIRKHIPENLDTICSPLITIILCSFIHIIFIMPIIGFISTLICAVIEMGCLSENIIIRGVIGYVSAMLFLPLVSMGMHHGLIAIYSVQLEKFGFVTLYPSLAMAGAGQVGAAIAIYIIAKRVKNKQICKVISSALPAGVLGIGEPLIYGVTLPLGKPFITAGLGAGFGGSFVMIKQVASTTWGPSGIFGLFIMTAGPNSAINSMIYYFIGFLISIVMGFIITYFMTKDYELIDNDSYIDEEKIDNLDNKNNVVIDNVNDNYVNVNNESQNNDEKIKISNETKDNDMKEYLLNVDKNMKVIKGKSATTGIAIGKVIFWGNPIQIKEEKILNIDEEIKRFDNAYNVVKLQMEKSINNVNEKIAEIIEVRKMMLEDKNFIDAIKSKIKEGFASEYATKIVGEEKASEFLKMDNDYLRARSADINDISNKLISVLCNVNTREIPDTPSIIISEEITPEEISGVDTSKVLAFATKKGSMVSHASIVASNLEIPYIFGIDYSIDEITDVVAIIDADNASLILNPDKKTIEEYNKRKNDEEILKTNYKTIEIDIDNKLKESNINVYANIANYEDVDMVIENGAYGIGLYRTEFLYMKKDTVPSEEEQFEAYKKVLSKMGDKEVIIRTMDIGADKEAKCLNLEHEENPALGRRAIRICLEDTNLFRTQLRALLRAGVYGNEKIMFPMIANEKEIDDIKEQINIAVSELKERKEIYKVPPIGIMVETPAVAILSENFAKKVDFFSIGTNDLTQYTLAVDRTGKNLDRFYRADDEAVFRLIKMTVDGANTMGIPVGICGEIAGNLKIIPRLIEIGVKEFSMSPSKIFKVKQTIVEYLNNNKNKTQINEMINCELVSPVDGEIISMDKIPDKAFSTGSLGRCIGINPENGNIYSPCDGKVITVAETKHAIGICLKNGKEILIHIGIDTVDLKGKGFDCKVKEGDEIKKGELLIIADLDIIKNANLSPIVILAITKE